MRQRRPKTVEQLEVCIRQEWDNIPIPKLEQLISMLKAAMLLNIFVEILILFSRNYWWNKVIYHLFEIYIFLLKYLFVLVQSND